MKIAKIDLIDFRAFRPSNKIINSNEVVNFNSIFDYFNQCNRFNQQYNQINNQDNYQYNSLNNQQNIHQDNINDQYYNHEYVQGQYPDFNTYIELKNNINQVLYQYEEDKNKLKQLIKKNNPEWLLSNEIDKNYFNELASQYFNALHDLYNSSNDILYVLNNQQTFNDVNLINIKNISYQELDYVNAFTLDVLNAINNYISFDYVYDEEKQYLVDSLITFNNYLLSLNHNQIIFREH